MGESRAELIFHPIRMRVIQGLLRGGRMTASQLSELLGDVPPATLYRHLKKLANGGVINVVEERPVRGVVERVYAVDAKGSSLTPREVAEMTPADHVDAFAVFLAGLLEQFERYAAREDADFVRDGVGYRGMVVYATDEEFHELIRAVKALFEERAAGGPGVGRRRRVVAGIGLPTDDPSGAL